MFVAAMSFAQFPVSQGTASSINWGRTAHRLGNWASRETFNLNVEMTMRLSRRERELLQTIFSLSEKLLDSPGGPKTNGVRHRRSKADAVELRKQVRAARRQNVPVKQIADRLGITPSYVYQLQR